MSNVLVWTLIGGSIGMIVGLVLVVVFSWAYDAIKFWLLGRKLKRRQP